MLLNSEKNYVQLTICIYVDISTSLEMPKQEIERKVKSIVGQFK